MANPLWQEFGWHIVATGLLVVVLIVGLLIQRVERRKVQGRLSERLRFEHLVAQVSSALAGLPLGRLDEQIRATLQRVGLLLGVDRTALWRLEADRRALALTHFWAADGVAPPPPTLPLPSSYLDSLVTESKSLTCPEPSGYPAEAEPALRGIGIRSLAAVPLKSGDRVLGALSVTDLRAERTWPEENLEQLATLAELLAAAILHEETQSALESSEAFTGAVLATLPGATAVVDADGRIVEANEAWRRLFGADRTSTAVGARYLTACRDAGILPAECAAEATALVEAVLAGREEEGALEYRSPRAGAGEDWYEMRVRGVRRRRGGAAIMHLDITARKAAEAVARGHLSQIAHMDRVAAMGELASSIAHELKQPLTAILTNAQTATRLLAASPPTDLVEVQACLTDIVEDDQRAAEILRRMRRLLRKSELEFVPIDLGGVVGAAVALMSHDALLHGVSIEFVPARSLPAVHADAVHIQQVVVNLLANAVTAAATGSATPRRVVVWTSPMDGRFIEIGVRDSGKGLAEGDLEHVFEPFYTTRREGLGMGLTISRTIVEAHGGRISAENDPERGGAIFRVHVATQPRAGA